MGGLEIGISEFLIIAIPLAFGIVGSLIIIYGGLLATINIVKGEVRKKRNYYINVRLDFTSKIVLGLEFFIPGI